MLKSSQSEGSSQHFTSHLVKFLRVAGCTSADSHLTFSENRQAEGGDLSATNWLPYVTFSFPLPVRINSSKSECLDVQPHSFGRTIFCF